jgi:catechol 2,3-dioxygenase-like lactoylglutathione lyase family enzyme
MSTQPNSQPKIFPKIDHITLNVKNFEKSKQFYKSLFVDYLGGFVLLDNEYVFGIRFSNNFLFEISPENPEFQDSKFNRYQVGLHHFALELENQEAVDSIYQKLLELEVKILDKPAFYPEYEDGYYALYWEDSNGFKMEFMCYQK